MLQILINIFAFFMKIFFDNDQWMFDPATDYMIRMLPDWDSFMISYSESEDFL